MNPQLIYLDNAATSFPKPRKVLERMLDTYSRTGGSPGRGGYDLAVEAGDLIDQARIKMAGFFGSSDAERVVFASNATDALNLAIQGIVGPGDHVVSTRLEHNSVLRPLHHLKERGWISYDLVPFDGQGIINPDDIAEAILPNTKLVVVSHASNVLGTIQPVTDIGKICAKRGVLLLVDTAQSAGHIPIDMAASMISIIAFTGHKALLGPTGIGGLVIAPDVDIAATRFGGTGIDSSDLIHTRTFPHRLEAGTLNMLGIIGLSAALDYLSATDMNTIHEQEMALLGQLREGLRTMKHVTLLSPALDTTAVPVLTCIVHGINPADAGAILDGDYHIAVRTGLHCAPLVHSDLGTGEQGAIRFSPGVFNTDEDIERTVEAMAELAGS